MTTSLSSAALAVMNAVVKVYPAFPDEVAAAAIRAAADQVVPMALCVYNDDFGHVRRQLNTIADELDAHLNQTR